MKGSILGRYGKIYVERYKEIHIWSEDMGWRAGVYNLRNISTENVEEMYGKMYTGNI